MYPFDALPLARPEDDQIGTLQVREEHRGRQEEACPLCGKTVRLGLPGERASLCLELLALAIRKNADGIL